MGHLNRRDRPQQPFRRPWYAEQGLPSTEMKGEAVLEGATSNPVIKEQVVHIAAVVRLLELKEGNGSTTAASDRSMVVDKGLV